MLDEESREHTANTVAEEDHFANEIADEIQVVQVTRKWEHPSLTMIAHFLLTKWADSLESQPRRRRTSSQSSVDGKRIKSGRRSTCLAQVPSCD